MSDSLALLEITGSPNNKKARMALNYKGLPFESRPLDLSSFPPDRSAVLEASNQPLTPVLLHGERAVFDSNAILRYLEANFPDTPPLFSKDVQRIYEIEDSELYAKTSLHPPVARVFGAIFGQGAPGPSDVGPAASEAMHAATEAIEESLGENDYLLGDTLCAADIFCAPFVWLAMVPAEQATTPVAKAFHEALHLGTGRDRTRNWVERVMRWNETTR